MRHNQQPRNNILVADDHETSVLSVRRRGKRGGGAGRGWKGEGSNLGDSLLRIAAVTAVTSLGRPGSEAVLHPVVLQPLPACLRQRLPKGPHPYSSVPHRLCTT